MVMASRRRIIMIDRIVRHPGENVTDYRQRVAENLLRISSPKPSANSPSHPPIPSNHTFLGQTHASTNQIPVSSTSNASMISVRWSDRFVMHRPNELTGTPASSGVSMISSMPSTMKHGIRRVMERPAITSGRARGTTTRVRRSVRRSCWTSSRYGILPFELERFSNTSSCAIKIVVTGVEGSQFHRVHRFPRPHPVAWSRTPPDASVAPCSTGSRASFAVRCAASPLSRSPRAA